VSLSNRCLIVTLCGEPSRTRFPKPVRGAYCTEILRGNNHYRPMICNGITGDLMAGSWGLKGSGLKKENNVLGPGFPQRRVPRPFSSRAFYPSRRKVPKSAGGFPLPR